MTVYLALGLVLAGIVWLLRNSGDPGRPPPPAKVPLSPEEQQQADLRRARHDLERQIQILQVPAGTGLWAIAPPDTRWEMQQLRQLLAGIDQELEASRE